jgi:hypothetical protein
MRLPDALGPSGLSAHHFTGGGINLIQLKEIIFTPEAPHFVANQVGRDARYEWRIQMKILIRAALTAISLATIPPVANAAATNDAAPAVQTESTAAWTNG